MQRLLCECHFGRFNVPGIRRRVVKVEFGGGYHAEQNGCSFWCWYCWEGNLDIENMLFRAKMTSLVTPRTKLGGGEAESTFRGNWYVEFIPVIAKPFPSIDGINE